MAGMVRVDTGRNSGIIYAWFNYSASNMVAAHGKVPFFYMDDRDGL
jgi:hypothetical protein